MARSPSFTVGIVQEAVTTDVKSNVERAESRVREAAEAGAQIVCLQELFNAPYFCKSQKHERFDLAEPIPGPTIEKMRKLARELELVIIVPIFERQAAGVYRNSAAVIDADGKLLGAYRKMHSPEDPLFNEKFYFTPGDSHLADDGDHKGASGF
ncbi:MAG: nitrilase-related carbon-nitrogen hydrolase, partial [Gemmatimonadaceae bacterium]